MARPARSCRAGAIAYRDQGAADGDIVRRAHVAHRRQLLAGLPWPEDALARLCDGQHDLQEAHYAAHHPAAERRMILHHGVAVGRLLLDRVAATWRIVDLALVPEAQGAGIGTAVLRALFAEAAATGVGLDLHVGRDNPRAEALYRRLGFVEAFGSGDTHRRMVRGVRPVS